jgi:hypothetical protein
VTRYLAAEWDWIKQIRYPERDFTQLVNLFEDPLELNYLAGEMRFLYDKQ